MRFKNIFIITSFTEFCDRFSYYGIQALLVLFLTKHFYIDLKLAYTIYGTYTALTFDSCILGGIIANRFLSQYNAALTGIIFIFFANLVLLFFTSLNSVYIALAMLTTSIGLIKPSTSCLIGTLYKKSAKQAEKAFVLFYLMSAIGSILGPIFYGAGIAHQYCNIGFIAGSILTAYSVPFRQVIPFLFAH